MKNDFQQYLETAKIVGAAAFVSELDRKPATDNLLLTLLEEIAIEQTSSVVKAWLIGYDSAKNYKKKDSHC